MNVQRYCLVFVAVFAVAIGLTDVAWAQQIEPGSQAVENNASGGAIRARAPGNMVAAGLARAVEAQDRLLSRPEITDTPESRPISVVNQARIEALQVMFTTIQQMIAAIHNAILGQAGRDSILVPPPDFPDVDRGGDGAGGGGGSLPEGLVDLLDGFH